MSKAKKIKKVAKKLGKATVRVVLPVVIEEVGKAVKK